MFKLYWLNEATEVIERAWDQADSTNQTRIVDALDNLNWKLTHAPQEQGESRDGLRVTWELPLGVHYFIDSESQTVYIIRAWLYR